MHSQNGLRENLYEIYAHQKKNNMQQKVLHFPSLIFCNYFHIKLQKKTQFTYTANARITCSTDKQYLVSYLRTL